MAQVVFIYVTSGTRIWQRWYYSMAINSRSRIVAVTRSILIILAPLTKTKKTALPLRKCRFLFLVKPTHDNHEYASFCA